jgi:hypothetical protein
MLRYPPNELTWEEVWKDAFISALQINTPESRHMAERPLHSHGLHSGIGLLHSSPTTPHFNPLPPLLCQ